MRKSLRTLLVSFIIASTFYMTAYAANNLTYSSYWYQDATTGAWKIRDGSGNTITSAFVVDNAVNPANTSCYIIDQNGNLMSGLVQDIATGNYYLLNSEHAGAYGSVIATSGYNYQGHILNFDTNTLGGSTYGRITNPEALAGLPVTQVNSASRVLYTSNFGLSFGGANISSASSGSSGSGYNAGSSTLGANNISVGNSGSVQQQSYGQAQNDNDLFSSDEIDIDYKWNLSEFSDEFLHGTVRFG